MADETVNTTQPAAPQTPTTPVATPAPAVTPAPQAAPAAQVAATPTAPTPQTPVPSEPAYIGERLKREQRALLKDLGFKVKKSEDPKTAISAVKSKIDSRNSERKELRGKLAEAEQKMAELQAAAAANQSAVNIFAAAEMSALPADKQEMVKRIAGDDKVEQLKQISALKMLGYTQPNADAAGKPTSAVTPPPQAAPAVPAAPAAPIAAPAQTAPSAPAPQPQASQPLNLQQEYDRVKSNRDTNPNEYYTFILKNAYALAAAANVK